MCLLTKPGIINTGIHRFGVNKHTRFRGIRIERQEEFGQERLVEKTRLIKKLKSLTTLYVFRVDCKAYLKYSSRQSLKVVRKLSIVI